MDIDGSPAATSAGGRGGLGRVGGGRGHKVGQGALELIAIEDEGQSLLLLQRSGLEIQVHIVPALGMEGIGDERRTQQKAHLRAGHVGLELGYRLHVEIVALLNVDLMRYKEARAQ